MRCEGVKEINIVKTGFISCKQEVRRIEHEAADTRSYFITGSAASALPILRKCRAASFLT